MSRGLAFSPGKHEKKPRIRMAGACSTCKGPRYAPAKAVVTMRVYEDDPFCSRKCCEAAHPRKSQTS